MKRLTTFILSLLLAAGYCHADQENLITISANGTSTTYAFSSFRSAIIEDPYAENLTMSVNFSDGTKQVGGIKTIIREVVPDEPQEEVEIKADTTSATFTWPQIPGAASYQLIIYKDDTQTERLCTLTFNSNGQLTNIDFNPQGPSTKSAQTIFKFTVTGLDAGRQYDYTMTALGSAGDILEEQEGTFETLTTSAQEVEENNVSVYTRSKTIVVDCEKESAIIFYDTLGRQVGDCIRTQHCECTVTVGGVYVVSVDGKIYKMRVE